MTRLSLALGLILIVAGLLLTGRVDAQPETQTQPEPAELTVIVFEQGRPVDDLILRFGDAVGRTSDGGYWRARLKAGEGRLTVFDNAQPLTALPLELRPAEIVQIIITLSGPERRARVSVESSLGGSAAGLADQAAAAAALQADAETGSGVLSGRVVSTEDGTPVGDARVFVSGTPIDIRTDSDGRFRAELPTGRYSVSVLHPDFATRTVDGLEVPRDGEVRNEFQLPPAGLELAEFVVVEPFIEGSLSSVVALRRESSAVTDVLSAEQISRAGDSDAGSALKRVTGLTLVDGSFIFVRGLGERYSSVLLNGANLPSPDPTRRVLPMDLFPTDIISQIVVQKTSDASMPGEFGGGSVQLKTVGYPEDWLFRIGVGSAWNSESTGQSGLTSPGGSRDWTGFDDGSRDQPELLAERTADGEFLRPGNIFNPDGVSPEELEEIGEQLAEASAYRVQKTSLPVDKSLSLSLGNSFNLYGPLKFGFVGALRYSDQWRLRDEQRDTFRFSNSGLQPNDSLAVQRTVRNIDLSAFINAGLELSDWTRVGVNVMLLRQSEDETRLSEGQQDSQILRRFRIEWTENELSSIQVFGEHRLPWTGLEADWQYSTATAARDDPNTRDWRRDDDNENGVFTFSRRADSNSQSWAELDDDLVNWSFNLSQPLPLPGPVSATLKGGMNQTERDRESSIRTFSFIGGVPSGIGELDQDEILVPEFIGPNGLRLREGTTPTDNYTAEQELKAFYGMVELGLFERLQLVGGMRVEDNFQEVVSSDLTNPDAEPTVGLIDNTDELWSGSLTWQFIRNAQLRLGFSETLSRPDFREISPSPFIDPLIDLRTVGNPDLQVAEITNLDARIEYYFNEIDSISFAYFYKELTNPIERIVSSGGSGTIITLQNALGAEIEGWEIDLYRNLGFVNQWTFLDRMRMGWLRRAGLENFFVAANYADISTSVNLDPDISNQTNANRALQGASPWVINTQLGYNSPDEQLEMTLLFNNFGERISQAGTQGSPDIFEQPSARLDFVFKYRLKKHWSFKFELENILDSEIEFTQGPETTRVFKPGLKVGLGLEFKL
ncbi:MAG: TonB-dependent receptor domain-containing protein [Wenzhouxiangellaceae bacterium]